MKTKLFATILCFLVGVFTFAQTIQFLSSKTGDPLSKVMVFNSSGDILTSSDIEGKIQKSELMPIQEQYTLIYDGYNIGNLKKDDLNSEIIKLNDRVNEIETVIVKSNNKAKYVLVRGNFNVYLTVNKQLNVYADGIATYVFDNDSKKLRSMKIEQYRAFTKTTESQDRKKVASMVYDSFLQLPDLRNAGLMNEYKSQNKKYKELEDATTSKMQYNAAVLQDKPLNLFGYSFYDFVYLNLIHFNKGSIHLRDFTEFNEDVHFKVKHKSEPQYSQFIKYANFFPTEISFANEDRLPRIKLDPSKSFYHFDFWKAKGFPNMQPVFADFFKDSLKEQPNSVKK